MSNELPIDHWNLYRRQAINDARNGDLLAFTKWTFNDYQINWHHRVLASYLNKFLKREIKRLMVFLPPRHGKSEMTSRRLPSMIHGLYPNDEILAACYNNELAADMTVDVQRIVSLPEYREIFPKVRIADEHSNSGYSRNKKEHEIMPYQDPEDRLWEYYKGSYKSSGLGGSFTGRGANWILMDDLIKNREEADSANFRESLWRWYQSTLRTRLEGEGSILLTMTRWHEDDIAGRLLELAKNDPNADQWVVLKMPAIKEGEPNEIDPRADGEPLWDRKFSATSLKQIKASSGSREWSALYQQDPVPLEGNLIKREWWKFYRELPKDPNARIVQFWDCAQKVGITNDFTVCATWMKTTSGYYCLNVWRRRVEAPELEQSVQMLFNKYKPSAVVIEDKSSGTSLIQYLRRSTTIPVLAYDPKQRDKEVRASAATPTIEAGNCYLPMNEEWVEDFISEHEKFPTATHDDQVDTTSMMVEHFANSNTLRPRVRSL